MAVRYEHMLVDYCTKAGVYDERLWQVNGGAATLASYGGEGPSRVVEWLQSLPRSYAVGDTLISHAFVHADMSLEEACLAVDSTYRELLGKSIIWNREEPVRQAPYRLQIAGHNSAFGLAEFSDAEGAFAICLDDSRNNHLTGIHLPTREIFQQEFID